MWRGFVKRRQTTHALAVKVAETGITGVKLPQVRVLGQQHAAVQRWCMKYMQSGAKAQHPLDRASVDVLPGV